jgi:hypothetical protein
MLFPYRGGNDIIDDEFMRYFFFVSDLLCYMQDKPLQKDEFKLAKILYSFENPDAIDNLNFLKSAYDCWCGFNIDEFFGKHFSGNQFQSDKTKIFQDNLNFFKQCCDEYGEYVGIFESTYQVRKYIGIDCRFPFGREYHGYYLFHYNGGEIKKSLGVFTSKMLTTTMYDDILALGDVDNIGDMISLKVVEEEKEEVVQKEYHRKITRQVNKYTLDGEYIETYDSISDAARANETFESSIRACCNRKTRRSGGFIYRFADDKEPVVMEKPASVRVSKDGKVSYKKRYVIE